MGATPGRGGRRHRFRTRDASRHRGPIPSDDRRLSACCALSQRRAAWAVRGAFNIFQADEAGCHIITATNDLIKKWSWSTRTWRSTPWTRSRCSAATLSRLDTFSRTAPAAAIVLLGLVFGLWGIRWGLPGSQRLARVMPPGLDGPVFQKQLADSWGAMHQEFGENLVTNLKSYAADFTGVVETPAEAGRPHRRNCSAHTAPSICAPSMKTSRA